MCPLLPFPPRKPENGTSHSTCSALNRRCQSCRKIFGRGKKQRLKNLKAKPSVENWHTLAKAMPEAIILFNRRRSGEDAGMNISDFEAATFNTVPQDDFLSSLSDLDRKKYVCNFVHVEVRGNVKFLFCSHGKCVQKLKNSELHVNRFK